MPKVSIGLPVYNGGRFLAPAIRSLLEQDFADLELIIADNASTDDSAAICKEFAARDPRVRYVRHVQNRGAVYNWNFVVGEARGEYFKWASANDIVAPTMLSECVAALDRDPSAILAYGRTQLIDDEGNCIGLYPHDLDLPEEEPRVRFRRALLELRLNNAQSGLHRLAGLRSTRLERSYPSGDMILMAELALHGKFVLLPEPLLQRRMGRDSASIYLNADQIQQFLDPSRKRQARFIEWRLVADIIWSVLRARLDFRERAACLAFAARYALWSRQKLLREFTDALLVRNPH